MTNNNDDEWCHYSGMPSPNFYTKKINSQWSDIPTTCQYKDITYFILGIDLENKMFRLQGIEHAVAMKDCDVTDK